MKTQTERIAALISRPQGATSMELIRGGRTTTPSRRVSDLREAGWTIEKGKVPGKNFHVFFGKAPKKK